eukprot:GHVS01092215.1.p1 GENE.GHVS01092215.1~~GHVS01092215.1.p1  ORF type:complete len:147 (-),score=24.35 GHVS01092215.1:215-655(-)
MQMEDDEHETINPGGQIKDKVQIWWDDKGDIRVLPGEQFKLATLLQSEASTFTYKMQQFSSIVEDLLQMLSTRADLIEVEKRKTIGLRLKTYGETEKRDREKVQVEGLVQQAAASAQRRRVFLASLEKIEKDQRVLLQQLAMPENT